LQDQVLSGQGHPAARVQLSEK